jgi:anaerobic ribonucleoside-triphosphate reductase activating protein
MLGLSRVHYPVTSLGYGVRAGVWFQGCSIGCIGCISRDTWPEAALDQQVPIQEVLDWLNRLPEVDGLTVSGGEPFEQPNALLALVEGFRGLGGRDDRDILVYSGRTAPWLQRHHQDLWTRPDAVIAGPYRIGRPAAWLRGSDNQTIHTHTPLGSRRYAPPERHRENEIQVAIADGEVWMIGIPDPGDLERITDGMHRRGILLSETSWRS